MSYKVRVNDEKRRALLHAMTTRALSGYKSKHTKRVKVRFRRAMPTPLKISRPNRGVV